MCWKQHGHGCEPIRAGTGVDGVEIEQIEASEPGVKGFLDDIQESLCAET